MGKYERGLEDIFAGKDPENNQNQNRNNNNNKNNQNNQNKNNNNSNNDSNNKKNKKNNNPLSNYYNNNSFVYDRDHMLKTLVNKNGLIMMIADIKKFRKSNNNGTNTSYVFHAVRDIIFASALPEAIDKVFFDKNEKYKDNGYKVSKKDLDYLMDEILYFCNGKNNKLVDKYGYDALDSMIKAYTNILYKLNKKRIKKFKDIDGLPEVVVKRIVVLTAGKTIQNSIYQLLKYFYELANDKTFSFTKKNTIKIFKACYGKKSMHEVAKCLMLEKTPSYELSKNASDLWVTLDEIMRDTLEDLSKSEIEKILKEYVSTRRSQEKNHKISRRLGDRRSIHPDDYKKLTKVFESLEEKDFSVVSLFRK